MNTETKTGEPLAQPEEVGRLMGRSGLGILLLAIAVGGPMLYPILPNSIDALVTMAQPWLLTAGIGFVGVGGVAKLRKLALLLHELGDRVDRVTRTRQ